MQAEIKDVERRVGDYDAELFRENMNYLVEKNAHTLARVIACRNAMALIKERHLKFFQVFFDLKEIYTNIANRTQATGEISYQDLLLRRGCDIEFRIYAAKIDVEFYEITKRYI